MNYLTDAQSLEFAAILDGYEETVATANAGKTDTLDDIRGALRKAGLKGSELADELASFREAVAERRLMRTNPQKAERKSKKRDGATDYLFVLTAPASRTHEGRNLTAGETARLDGALILASSTHDPETGEIIEQNPLPVDGVESMGSGARAIPAETMLEPKPGNAAGRTAEDELISAEGGSPSHEQNAATSGAPAIESGTDVAAPESCGSDEGIAVRADSTLAGKQDAYSAAGAAEQGTAACAESDDETVVASQPVVEPGPQDKPPAIRVVGGPVPSTSPFHPANWPDVAPRPQQHRTVGGKPLTPVDPDDFEAITEQRRKAMPDIPAFLDRRTPTQGTA